MIPASFRGFGPWYICWRRGVAEMGFRSGEQAPGADYRLVWGHEGYEAGSTNVKLAGVQFHPPGMMTL